MNAKCRMQNAKCKVQNGGKVFGKAKVIYRQKNFVGTQRAVSAKYPQTIGKGRYIKPYINIRLTVNLRRVYEGDPVRKRMLSNKDRFYNKSAVKRLDEVFYKHQTHHQSSPSLRRRPVGKVSFRHKGRFVYFADQGKVKALAARACRG